MQNDWEDRNNKISTTSVTRGLGCVSPFKEVRFERGVGRRAFDDRGERVPQEGGVLTNWMLLCPWWLGECGPESVSGCVGVWVGRRPVRGWGLGSSTAVEVRGRVLCRLRYLITSGVCSIVWILCFPKSKIQDSDPVWFSWILSSGHLQSFRFH